MALRDLERVEKAFEKEQRKAAKALVGLIDERMKVLRRIVPGAEYNDAMGSQSLSDRDAGDQRVDAMYEAFSNVEENREPRRPQPGEPLEEWQEKALILTEQYGHLIKEILDIGEFLNNVVHHTYS